MLKNTFPYRRLGLTVAVAAAALSVSACDTPIQVRGNLPEVEDIARIEPGINNRDQVMEILGSPSAISTFQDKKWYYIGEKTEQFAFWEPEVLDRSVLLISFDDQGIVDQTRLFTLGDARDIDPVDRKTPTEGKDLTLLQQLFGNLGRFNTGEGSSGNPGSPGPVPRP